ncbi:MAG TPA: tetratricopeptide repeat protein, partial [Gemmatimonadales bacterium]|nr:tetratricopeptide repeat protein [Gemmatimonadales bacterium]
MSATIPLSTPAPSALGVVRPAGDLLLEARGQERAGCMPEAVSTYEAAITAAERAGEVKVLAEALRRLAVVRHNQGDSSVGRELVRRSHSVARADGNALLAAEALNTLGGIELQAGELEAARAALSQALVEGGQFQALRARVQQHLGIIANIQGDMDAALSHYSGSLESYQGANDEHGCAIAYHNLGMISADRDLLPDADRYFTQSYDIAHRAGDVSLQGLCLVNHADVDIQRQMFEEARRKAEAALVLFDQLGDRGSKSTAYRVIGMVYRETGKAPLAESRLKSSIELASTVGYVLSEAESTRELAILY